MSVIIPVHNGERYLAEAVQSVLDTRHESLEILVVDDGSSDGSAEIASGLKKVRLLQQEQSGAATARHLGVQVCQGEYVAFLDADDRWTQNKMNAQLSFLQERPDCDGVFGHVRQFVCPDWKGGPTDFDARPQLSRLPGALLMRRNCYQQAGDFNSLYRAGELVDWYLRAEEAGCVFGSVEELVLERRLHPNNHGRLGSLCRQDYARVVMAALRRRRQASC